MLARSLLSFILALSPAPLYWIGSLATSRSKAVLTWPGFSLAAFWVWYWAAWWARLLPRTIRSIGLRRSRPLPSWPFFLCTGSSGSRGRAGKELGHAVLASAFLCDGVHCRVGRRQTPLHHQRPFHPLPLGPASLRRRFGVYG